MPCASLFTTSSFTKINLECKVESIGNHGILIHLTQCWELKKFIAYYYNYRKSSNKTFLPIIPEFLIIPAFSTILLN